MVDEPNADEILAGIEPLARGGGQLHRDTALTSIAISLKRIADAVTSPEGLPTPLFNTVLDLAWQAGRNFEAGRKVA